MDRNGAQSLGRDKYPTLRKTIGGLKMEGRVEYIPKPLYKEVGSYGMMRGWEEFRESIT